MPLPPNLPLPTLGGKQLWADVFVYGGWRIQQQVWTGHHRLLDRADVRHGWGTFTQCLEAFDRARARHAIVVHGDHLVLLLHGIFRAKDAFRPMRRALRSAGFEAEAVNYPSTRRSLDDHARQVTTLLDRVAAYTDQFERVSLVGHSMGGIVARLVFAHPGQWAKRLAIGRLVTIGTPHHAAILIDRFKDLRSFDVVAGPAGRELAPDAFPDLPAPTCRFGVVAGARGDGKGWNPGLPGDDDMTVSLESALLEGAEDTLIVKGVHTFLMQRPDVVAAVVAYLRTGKFARADG
jgi:pimeloyl-ACP methyl ester carboxylesterase